MEETAKVIGGVAGELLFFSRSFFLGFMLRMCYDPLVLLRKALRHPWWLVNLQDVLFWAVSSLCMFGLLFRENNGTPRLFALAGILAGMILYHLGPGKLICVSFVRFRKGIQNLWKKWLKKKEKSDMIKEQQ